MARNKKLEWQDAAIILLIILVVVTNAYWLMAVQDINNRLDGQAFMIDQALKANTTSP